jgi:large subunit ribosomal protein L9
MKVLLRSDIRGVGRRGDVVEVKSGYARNFLLPSGAALVASDNTELQAASMRRARDLRDDQSREAAETQRALIDIVNVLRTATGISLDRHAIHMAEHLKEVGSSTVTATLFDGVEATINVEVVAK